MAGRGKTEKVSSAAECDIGHLQGLIGLKPASDGDLPPRLRHGTQLLGNAVRGVYLQLWRWPRKDPFLRRVTNGMHLHNHLFLPLRELHEGVCFSRLLFLNFIEEAIDTNYCPLQPQPSTLL